MAQQIFHSFGHVWRLRKRIKATWYWWRICWVSFTWTFVICKPGVRAWSQRQDPLSLFYSLLNHCARMPMPKMHCVSFHWPAAYLRAPDTDGIYSSGRRWQEQMSLTLSLSALMPTKAIVSSMICLLLRIREKAVWRHIPLLGVILFRFLLFYSDFHSSSMSRQSLRITFILFISMKPRTTHAMHAKPCITMPHQAKLLLLSVISPAFLFPKAYSIDPKREIALNQNPDSSISLRCILIKSHKCLISPGWPRHWPAFSETRKNYRRALSSCFSVKIKLYKKFLILMMTEEILYAIYEASILFTNYNDNLRLLARN